MPKGEIVSLKNSFDIWVPTHLTTFYVEAEYIMHTEQKIVAEWKLSAEQKIVAEWSSVAKQKSDAKQDLVAEWYSYI